MKAPQVTLLVPGSMGVYVPQQFYKRFYSQVINTDKHSETLNTLNDPDHEFYWDAWDEVLGSVSIQDQGGTKYTLHQDGDLWAIPEGWEWDEDSEEWIAPTPEGFTVYTLPACWASSLINGDDTGLEADELEALNYWEEKENPGDCVSCSSQEFPTRYHDACRRRLTQCLRFTFQDPKA